MRETIADKLKINVKDVILSDKKDGKPLINSSSDSKLVSAIIKAKSANQFLISNAKCEIDTSQLEQTLQFSRQSRMSLDDTQSMIDKEKEEKKKELDKGNIMAKNKKEKEEEEQNKKKEEFKQVNSCTHGPNGKCPNCIDKDKVKDTKHVSLDE